jgi:hypothetical protein
MTEICGVTRLPCNQCNPGPCGNRLTSEPHCLRLCKESGELVDVLLLPHKDGSGWSYVNLTNGHICPCVFPTYADAVDDLNNHNIRDFHFIETCDTREGVTDERP